MVVSKRMSSGPSARKLNARRRRRAGRSSGRGRTGSRRPGRSRSRGRPRRCSRSWPDAGRRAHRNATQSRPGARDRRRIGIEAQQSAVRFGGLQDPEGVPSATERRVDMEAARAGESAVMTSSTITGRCPSSSHDRPGGPPGSRRLIWWCPGRLDTQPLEVLGEHVGLVHPRAVSSQRWATRLEVVARAHDHRLGLQSSRSPAGRGTTSRPCRSSSTSKAAPKMKR